VTPLDEPARPLGPDPRLASALAYLAWWLSGAVVWLVEPDRPAVRFHAMQSMLAFGTAFLAWATLWGGSFAVLVVSASGFFLLQRLAQPYDQRDQENEQRRRERRLERVAVHDLPARDRDRHDGEAGEPS